MIKSLIFSKVVVTSRAVPNVVESKNRESLVTGLPLSVIFPFASMIKSPAEPSESTPEMVQLVDDCMQEKLENESKIQLVDR